MSEEPANGLDWRGLMRAGLHGLGLKPAEFWQLTPVELMIMLGRDGSQAPLTRGGLEDLLRQYPDAGPGEGGGDG